MYEGSDSFGECHSETIVSPTASPQGDKSEAGFSKWALPVALSLSPLCSCHSDPLPEPRCSSDLTSSPISCLLLKSC